MSDIEIAELILAELDEEINVNWEVKDTYIKAIVRGLTKAYACGKDLNEVKRVIYNCMMDNKHNPDRYKFYYEWYQELKKI